jgi:hypothetical protein
MKPSPPGSSLDDAPIESAPAGEKESEAISSIGILPPGALGVAFFFHLTQKLEMLARAPVFFGLAGSKSFRSLAEAGFLNIRDDEMIHRLPVGHLLISDLGTSYQFGRLPSIILVATNPDQLFQVIDEMIGLLERMARDEVIDQEPMRFPRFIFCSNGIYFQRLRQVFLEKLEESILLGRLPDLWPSLMPRVVGRLIRGVTIQPGLRDGDGAAAIYRPGHSAVTRIAGGDETDRKDCVTQLAKTGARFELVADQSATRIEFDKAIVNLTGNLLGIIYSTNSQGIFSPLTIGEIFSDSNREDIRQLAEVVLRIGKSVKAYRADEPLERILEDLDRTAKTHRDHLPSSLQYVSLLLSHGKLTGECTPTEEWLLRPLIKYAEAADLRESAVYLQNLRERLVQKLTAAAANQAKNQE